MADPIKSILSKYNQVMKIAQNESQSKMTEATSSPEYNANIVVFLKKYDFSLPIEYCSHRRLSNVVRDDLEMSGDLSDNIINGLLETSGMSSKYNLLIDKWSSTYSLDKKFLKDNQKVLKSYKGFNSNMDDFIGSYSDFKRQNNFLSRFQYIQFKRFRSLNKTSEFLQFLALYNFCTPLMSLLMPIIGLIMPYFVLYFKGIRIGFKEYMTLVRGIVLNQYIIKGLLNFRKNTLQSNAYVLSSMFFYFLSIYNNIVSCVEFHGNVEFMIKFIDRYNEFISNGDKLIDSVYKYTHSKKTFKSFNEKMLFHKSHIQDMKRQICEITDCDAKYMKYVKIGKMLKCNFDLFYNKNFDETIGYLIYLNNFNADLSQISTLVQDNKMNACTFMKTKTSKKPAMKGSYYLPHINSAPISNDISMKTNMLITGPNASGKTTLIKTTLINLFLSQSLGYGCYQKCKMQLYDHYHSYLNIPDTSSRDSLFQAEARRCKEIMTFIQKHKKSRHFCVFDEIYSGTNPNDAVLCATIYLKDLNKYKSNVDYLLTTHYVDICENFKIEKTISNNKMKVIVGEDGKINYKYKLISGISKINGGYQILEQLK